MSEYIKVSVMVLAYNHEMYIRQALDSIVMQKTNFAFEAIIGEDKSTDNTRKIIQEYAQKYPDIIKPIFRGKNLGASRNVVSTLRRCKGEYIAYLECDDYWIDPLKLQKQVDFLEGHQDYAGVMSDVLVISRYGKSMVTGPKILSHELRTPQDYAQTMYPYNQFKFIGCLMTRNFYKNGKYEKYLLQTKIVTDQIIGAITIIHGKIGMISEYLAAYRWVPSHGNNYSAMKTEPLCNDRIKSLKVVQMLLPPSTHSWIYMRISRDYWQLFHSYMVEKEYGKLLIRWFCKMSFLEQLFYVVYYLIRKFTGVY